MSLPEDWAHGNCFSGPCIWTLPSSHIELGGGRGGGWRLCLIDCE